MTSAHSPPVSNDGQERPSRRGRYIPQACNECKRRKIKCNGKTPCACCFRQNINCIYSPRGRRQPNRSMVNLSELDQLRNQISTLQKQLGDQQAPSTPNSPVDVSSRGVDRHMNIQNQPSPPILQDFEAAQTVRASDSGEAAGGDDPQGNIPGLQATSRCTYNFSLAKRNLEAIGILGVNQDGRPQNPANQPPKTMVSSPPVDPLWSIDREEALRLARVYEEEIGSQYPFLNPVKVIRLVTDVMSALEVATRHGFRYAALPGREVIDPNDVQIVKLVLATASIIETSGVTSLGERLSKSVQDSIQSSLWTPVNTGTIETYTLFAIYAFLSDNDLLAWRLIGVVARWCLELGLNQAFVLDRLYPDDEDRKYGIRLFWCVHTLDRRWGFGTGLPFVLSNDDIDSALPEPDNEVPYLRAMVSYSRIGSRVWHAAYRSKASKAQSKLNEVGFLDYLVTQWTDQLPESLKIPRGGSPEPTPSRSLRRQQLLLHLRAGQLKILLYQPVLHSFSQLRCNWPQAEIVVDIAKDTIRKLDHLKRTSDIYETQQICFNHFLVSALGVVFLAVSLAPESFSEKVREEFHMALDLVKSFSSTSHVAERLWKMIKGLQEIGEKLGISPPHNNHSRKENGQRLSDPLHISNSDIQGSVPPAPFLQLPGVETLGAENLSALSAGDAGGFDITQDLAEIFETLEQGGNAMSDSQRDPAALSHIDHSLIANDFI